MADITNSTALQLCMGAERETGSESLQRLLRGMLDWDVVPTNQAAHITDAVVAHDVNATFSDTEVEATLDALGTKINAILVVLETAKLTASS